MSGKGGVGKEGELLAWGGGVAGGSRRNVPPDNRPVERGEGGARVAPFGNRFLRLSIFQNDRCRYLLSRKQTEDDGLTSTCLPMLPPLDLQISSEPRWTSKLRGCCPSTILLTPNPPWALVPFGELNDVYTRWLGRK